MTLLSFQKTSDCTNYSGLWRCIQNTIAYILLQCGTTRVGALRWFRPPMRRFRVIFNTNMLVSKKPCRPNATPNVPNATPYTPNVTPYTPNSGHVHFMLFLSISFALGSQHERSFQWNMGLLGMDCSRYTIIVILVTKITTSSLYYYFMCFALG